MTHAAPGIGSQYAYTVDDAHGDTLDGSNNDTLTLPAPIPVTTFWAIDIYDTQTRSLLQTIPNKSWFLILRLDGPLQAWFDRTWRSGELQPA